MTEAGVEGRSPEVVPEYIKERRHSSRDSARGVRDAVNCRSFYPTQEKIQENKWQRKIISVMRVTQL